MNLQTKPNKLKYSGTYSFRSLLLNIVKPKSSKVQLFFCLFQRLFSTPTNCKLHIIIYIVSGLGLFAQEGDPFITNITSTNGNRNFIWSVTQSAEEMMFFAGRDGLMIYDAESWINVDLDHPPLSMKYLPSSNKVYTGGKNQVGYVWPSPNGTFEYVSVVDSLTNDEHFTTIHTLNDTVYFLSAHEVIRVLPNSDMYERILKNHSRNRILGSFINKNQLFLNIKDKGLVRIDRDTITALPGGNALHNQEIVFDAPYDRNSTLLGTLEGALMIYRNEKDIQPAAIQDQGILSSGIITDGVVLSDSLTAISTRNNGTLIINIQTGKTMHYLHTLSGIPSDFHVDLFKDSDHALWIAHPMGISRVDITFPAREFTGYGGLEGNILRTSFWNNQLYVATTFGLYLLDTLKKVDKKQVTKRIPVKQPIQAETDDSNDDEKENLFSRLISNVFGKGKKEEDQEEEIKEPSYRYVQREITKEYNAGYIYRKAGNIDAKCKQLISFEGGLLALTDTILYNVNKQYQSTPILTSPYIYEIVHTANNPKKIYAITFQGVFAGTFEKGQWKFDQIIENTNRITVESFSEVDKNGYLFITDVHLLYGTFNQKEPSYDTIWQLDDIYYSKPQLKKTGNHIYVIAGNNLYQLQNASNGKFNISKVQNMNIHDVIAITPDNIWLQNKHKQVERLGPGQNDHYLSLLQVFNHLTDITPDDAGNLWVVNDRSQVYKLDIQQSENYNYPMPIAIKKIENMKGESMNINNLEVEYSNNALRFFVSSPFYLKVNTVQYRYTIEGLMQEWSDWLPDNRISIPYLPPGKYIFHVKSRNIFGKESEIKSVDFRVNTPFWRTNWFYLACILLLAVSVFIWQRIHVARLRHNQRILEEKVRTRTEEIENQKLKIERQNKSINDSITYASRIQRALLPSKRIMNEYLKDHFIFFKPRELVSGDFYWAARKDNDIVMVAADCTGHGVPGAFMSIMGIAYLNEIINKQKFNSTSDILTTLRSYIIDLLKKNYTDKYPADGMDISILLLNKEQGLVQFSGAYNSVYRVTARENIILPDMEPLIKTKNNTHALLEYKVDRMSIGFSDKLDAPFTAHTVPYIKGDIYYLFSDGFPDQFGGNKGKKFMYRQFREELLNHSTLPMNQQYETLDQIMTNWMNGHEQIDDMLVLGIKI